MKKLFIFAGIAAGLLIPGLLRGQEIGLLRVNPDSLVSQREAAIWGGFEEGRFKPAHGALTQWSAGAGVKSVRHGKNSSWTGALSLEQTTGYEMGASLLLEPDYFPLDIVETHLGTKSRQDVSLEGGFLSDFGYEWAAGIKASAKASLVSEDRPLSHNGFGLDLQAEPTLTYVMDDDMGLVSSYIARLRTENFEVTQIVDTEDGTDPYAPFLDKGMLFVSPMPGKTFDLLEFSHGVSELFYSPELTVGAEIIWKRGMAGESKYKFPGSTLSLFAEYAVVKKPVYRPASVVAQAVVHVVHSLRHMDMEAGHAVLADKADHVMRMGYKRQRDQLRQDADGGIIGLSGRRVRNLGLKYEARFLNGILKSAGVALDGNQWYEYSYVSQGDQVRRFDGTATFLAAFSAGIIDLDLNFLAGKGWWKDRGRAAMYDGTPEPDRMTDLWLRKMEYQMVPRVGMGGTLTCRIPAVKGLYTQLYGYWYHAGNVTYLRGRNREIASLRIGYKF